MLYFFAMVLTCSYSFAQKRKMMFADTSGAGVPFSKDPMVIKFKGRYLLYYSKKIMNDEKNPMNGWNIGIAESKDMIDWQKVGEIKAQYDYEKKGLCAPGAIVKDGQVHLFYQTYGNGPKDAICHASSNDGVHFIKDPTNPVFHPTGLWTNGRAIDAEVVPFKQSYMLYFATRDPANKVQQQGVARASITTDFGRSGWKQLADSSILKPTLPWEGLCVEAASVTKHGNKMFMFYAGNYNNSPQQIGVASSTDGIKWTRLANQPFLANGKPGQWNSSESGHPCIFKDDDGRTYLFFQGNNDKGKTWYLSKVEVGWKNDLPYVIESKL